jgi:hypothetical protein
MSFTVAAALTTMARLAASLVILAPVAIFGRRAPTAAHILRQRANDQRRSRQ